MLDVWEESADAYLNAYRKPFPNAFLTIVAIDNIEHVTVGHFTVSDRIGVAMLHLVLGDNLVTLARPHARQLAAA